MTSSTCRSAYRSVLRPDLFAGQLHWVTGGGSGIGRCVAHELASLGATVVLSGRSDYKLERVAAEIAEDAGRAVTRAFDIRDEEAVTVPIDGGAPLGSPLVPTRDHDRGFHRATTPEVLKQCR
jgi:nucleoside-diphosphate-sugar epimerase